jgi:hypothetical protein
MLTFIVGASSTGALVASATAVTASSASPAARRASVLAVVGAMIIRSAASATWMCPIVASSVRLNRSVNTGRPLRAWNVSAPTNSVARAVMQTCTVAPALMSRRTSSAALYAAMPPATPTTTRLPASGESVERGVTGSMGLLQSASRAASARASTMLSSIEQ